MKNKIAVFSGDMFWSTTPYEPLDVFNALSELFDTDLIMFKKDIRLNKIFKGFEKFKFNSSLYKSCKNLLTIENWQEFEKLAKDYKIILCSAKIYPKTRYPSTFDDTRKNGLFEKVYFWDVGGPDLFTDVLNAHKKHITNQKNVLVKSNIWKEYIHKIDTCHNVNVVGAPQYDPFIKNYKGLHSLLSGDDFCKKYQLKSTSKKILVAPHNPGSHKDQFNENLLNLEKIFNFIDKNNKNYEVLVKTYPHDYVFYEPDGFYTGVYKRYYNHNEPQYSFLKKNFPKIKVIESQDHFSALKNSDLLFNMSGSTIAWETFWTKCQSFSMNYKNKPYYSGVSYLPSHIFYPDQYFTTELNSVENIFTKVICNNKAKGADYLTQDLFSNKIKNVIEKEIRKV